MLAIKRKKNISNYNINNYDNFICNCFNFNIKSIYKG